MHFPHGAAHHLHARNVFIRAEDVVGTVIPVNVRRNEIHRHLGIVRVLDKLINPRGLCRRRSADADPRTHTFQRTSRVVVKIEVTLLLGRACPEIDVGFIPDFEIPLRNLIYDRSDGARNHESSRPTWHNPSAAQRWVCTKMLESRQHSS